MVKPIIKYHSNGNKQLEIYYLNNKCHNDKGSAYTFYYENGKIKSQYYYLNGKWLKDINSLEELQRYIKLNNIS